MYLVFDTETTGKAHFKAQGSDPCQPRLVQLGALLLNSNWAIMAELNVVIKPQGFTISDEVSKIHGITQDIANAVGVDEEYALLLFNNLARAAGVLVAHNIKFDTLVLERAMTVNLLPVVTPPTQFCTMAAMTDICKIPGPYCYKWPKLTEAYYHLFKEQFSAHNAMDDVRACARVFRHLMEAKQKVVDGADKSGAAGLSSMHSKTSDTTTVTQ